MSRDVEARARLEMTCSVRGCGSRAVQELPEDFADWPEEDRQEWIAGFRDVLAEEGWRASASGGECGLHGPGGRQGGSRLS